MSDGGCLADYRDAERIESKLRREGLSPEACGPKAAMFGRCEAKLREWGLKESQAVAGFFVPGRIEVLGKHTDYAGGRSVVAAAERGFCLLAAPRKDAMIRMAAIGPGEECQFDFSPELEPVVGHWSNYPMTTVKRIAKNFAGDLVGADIVFDSDLPAASGMSSSSALIIAIFLGLDGINGLRHREAYREHITTPEELAGYLATIENGQSFGTLVGDKGVGTFGGSEDHTAILCCSCGVMNQYSYCPVRFERYLPMPGGTVFAIASSGVVAEKTRTAMEKYNLASRRAGAIAELWRAGMHRKDMHLAAINRSIPQANVKIREIIQKDKHESFPASELIKRLDHFLSESEQIIPAAGNALIYDQLAEFGKLVDLSQQLSEELLGNQIAETVSLARLAREHGAIAASAFGAGFGGSVWAMVESDKAESFLKRWRQSYTKAHKEPAKNANFFTTSAGPAAFEINLS